MFQAEVPKGSGAGEIVFFLPAVNHEVLQESYCPEPPCQDVQTEDEVENCLSLLASMDIADDGDASDYGSSAEDTSSKGETAVQKNLWLNHNHKAAADKQTKNNHD